MTPVAERAMPAATALTGRRAKAATGARKAMMGRRLVFMFFWILWLPREHGPSPKVTGNASARVPARGHGPERRAKQGLGVVAVHPGYEVVRDKLGARRAALVLVRAAAEPEPVHRADHGQDAPVALGLALGEEPQVGDLRRDEEHRARVLAGGDAGAAPDALRGVHRQVGDLLRDRDRVALGRRARPGRDEAARLLDLVKGAPVGDQVLDDGKR